jgi:hypothetical protein
MRPEMLLVVVAGAAACAGRAPVPTTLAATTYSCGDREIRHASDQVRTAESALGIGWRDGEGRHYVAWPTSATSREAREYVIPADSKMDAVERVYDTSRGTSRVDWRMIQQSTCTANGGYSDALARFASGKSFDQVARELGMTDKTEARELVHQALLSVQKRYYKDR